MKRGVCTLVCLLFVFAITYLMMYEIKNSNPYMLKIDQEDKILSIDGAVALSY